MYFHKNPFQQLKISRLEEVILQIVHLQHQELFEWIDFHQKHLY